MESKVALVTGAGRGIGRAIAVELARKGHKIAVHYRSSESQALAVVEEIRALGAEAEAFHAELSDSAQVTALFTAVKERFGPVEILVNNAGLTRDGLMMRMNDQDWQSVLDADLNSVFYCSREAIKAMTKKRWGRIVNLSSVVGLMGNVGQANYCAAKAGIIGFSKSVAREYGSRNITVNCVAPGYIGTEMTQVLPEEIKERMVASTPLGRMGTPEDIASAVVFLTSEGASFITGQVLAVDGGMTMM